MTTAILSILAALVPFLIWLWKGRVRRKAQPYEQHQHKREALAREIIERDDAAANRSLDDDLDKLRSLQSHRRRPDNSFPPRR